MALSIPPPPKPVGRTSPNDPTAVQVEAEGHEMPRRKMPAVLEYLDSGRLGEHGGPLDRGDFLLVGGAEPSG